jgi:hypothetical protein
MRKDNLVSPAIPLELEIRTRGNIRTLAETSFLKPGGTKYE